jgi:hypothetical protein
MSSSHTSSSSNKRVEADTIKRTRFFHAYDQQGKKSLQKVCMKKKISYDTVKK